MEEAVLIIDFGSQFTHLIAKKSRLMNIYSIVISYEEWLSYKITTRIKCIVLSGGYESSLDSDRYDFSSFFMHRIPILGICFGMQKALHYLGGEIVSRHISHYGETTIHFHKKTCDAFSNTLLYGIDYQNYPNHKVWSSHCDCVLSVPQDVEVLASSYHDDMSISIPMLVYSNKNKFCGIQFHPEVSETHIGKNILHGFFRSISNITTKWEPENQLDVIHDNIRTTVGDKRVLCALSGGVDSTVLATFLERALSPFQCMYVFIDNGFLRSDDLDHIRFIANFLKLEEGKNFFIHDARNVFLKALYNISDPEEKRKIVGRVFIEQFNVAISSFSIDYFAQGTIYSDYIESKNFSSLSNPIKSHHNVGGLPKELGFLLIEPFKHLFKNEVRDLGEALGLPKKILYRHPFPGPGLSIRCSGKITEKKISILRDVDKLLCDMLHKYEIYYKIWQSLVVLVDDCTVGCMGDARVYFHPVVLKAVVSHDGMTASPYIFTDSFIKETTQYITNNSHDVCRVLWDFTSKPPATIEWE